MKRTYLLLVLFIGMGSISAQSFVGKLNMNPDASVRKFASNDTLRILAVMADFPKDVDDATFGDGTFGSIYSKDYGTDILDPLPHDKEYFENHLKFVQNYFAKVSDGKLNISFTLLDDILTVSKTMRNYTPSLDDLNDHTPLGNYTEEVWKLADQQYPNFDFSQYDLFFVFHAGVGKDVSLPGSIGNERDLPSVYLNKKSLQNIFGSNFEGFPVSGGSFKITNSAILPETESRELGSFNGLTLIELTTNGLISATVASYLGLPDLYNTETGRSAIGRFGLMDGQSMFTFQGIFPPEPSAWEKMFLGWVTPTEISIGNAKLNLVNKYVANLGDTTLIKIPINATEYYLIENRKRDALLDGSTITYISNGQTYTKTFDRDYEKYIYYSVDTLKGVIVDVDEYDWSLPSFDRDSKIENFKDVGIIIWHIDERIIDENYESNTINNDRYTRGVAIVEADGIRDIGEEFKTVFGERVIGEGTKEDTWYTSNPSEYYENKFSIDTKPKAESNTKTNSLIALSDFSEASNRASFKVSFGSDNIDLISNLELSQHYKAKWLSSVFNRNETVQFAFSKSQIIKFNSNGIIYNSGPNREVARIIDYKPLLVGIDGKEIFVKTHSSILTVSIFNGASRESFELTLGNGDIYSTSAVLLMNTNNSVDFLIGTENGNLLKYSIDITSSSISLLESTKIFNKAVKQIAVADNYYSAIADEYYWNSKFAVSDSPINLGENANQLVNSKIGTEDISVIQTDNSLISISNLDEINEIKKTDLVTPFALTDLKNDGSNYIIQNNGKYFESSSLTGAMANNFPLQDEFEVAFISSPLSADLNNDEAADIIAFTEDGKVLAIDGLTGKMIDGFPISSGAKVATPPILFTENGRTALGLITENNRFLSWNISKYDGKQFWTEENGSANNSSSVDAAKSTEKITEFFPQSKAYNWPNPVYEGTTNIRYFVSEDSKTEVTIFDLAGDLVAKLSGNGVGGFDNEIVWNVNNIQSGVYFAHLQVTGISGKTDSKIIKIAVIK